MKLRSKDYLKNMLDLKSEHGEPHPHKRLITKCKGELFFQKNLNCPKKFVELNSSPCWIILLSTFLNRNSECELEIFLVSCHRRSLSACKDLLRYYSFYSLQLPNWVLLGLYILYKKKEEVHTCFKARWLSLFNNLGSNAPN